VNLVRMLIKGRTNTLILSYG